jgi:polyhydroxybutyrate depolymerase
MNFKFWMIILLLPLSLCWLGWGDGQIRGRIRDRIVNRVSEAREPQAAPAESSTALEHVTMNFGGLARTYHVYRPKAQASAPLVIVLHGGRGNGPKFMQGTGGGLNQLADQNGFIVIYPDAVEGNWNDGRSVQEYRSQASNIDDVGFLLAIMDQFISNGQADSNRIYLAGVSNGAMMTYRFLGTHAERIRAAATVIGSIPKNIAAQYHFLRPVPLLIINSTEDPIVPWKGGVVRAGRVAAGEVVPVPETLGRVVSENKTSDTPQVSQMPDRAQDGTHVRQEIYTADANGSEVVFYAVEGGGHAWPGSSASGMAERFTGKATQNINASQLISDFFRKH